MNDRYKKGSAGFAQRAFSARQAKFTEPFCVYSIVFCISKYPLLKKQMLNQDFGSYKY